VTSPKKPAARRPRPRRRPAAAVPTEPSTETPLDTFLEPPAPAAPAEAIPDAKPEPGLAARVPPPEPERPRQRVQRAVFFDVENSSRADHVSRLLGHLDIDRTTHPTELFAVGNWRVINHDTARMLAQRGAHMMHTAPSVGVRDWSDLRIAVAAGLWLAQARPGDTIDIVTDDQAFDAVGDVATSLGIRFRRLSYRGITGATEERAQEPPASESRSRRRRRGGRRRESSHRVAPPPPPVAVPHPIGNGGAGDEEGHTAPHD